MQSSENTDLANLVGIAGALNRAAHKSRWRRDRKALKNATVLYGCAEPDRAGNIDDDVAEILDLVEDDGLPDEALEEREVVILRDVDEKVAAEVVETINNMSQEEAESQGGKYCIERLFSMCTNSWRRIISCKIEHQRLTHRFSTCM